MDYFANASSTKEYSTKFHAHETRTEATLSNLGNLGLVPWLRLTIQHIQTGKCLLGYSYLDADPINLDLNDTKKIAFHILNRKQSCTIIVI